LIAVVEIGVAAQEAFGARRKHERESELARRCHRGGDTLGRLDDVEERLVIVASGRGVLERRADEACGCGLTVGLGHVLGRPAEAALEIRRAPTMARACASAWSRVIPPSRAPYVPADAPLEVAIAAKPRPTRMRADPASQALAMTNARVP
jgi:hypothetical protein